MYKICSKLKVKTPERPSSAFIADLEQISHIVLVF